MTDPELARERWHDVQDASALEALRARCEAAAVEELPVAFSWRAYHPRPFSRELSGEDPRAGGSGTDAWLGRDAAGRVVFQRLRDDLFVLCDWADSVCDVVEFNGEVRRLERLVFADGKLVEEIEIDGGVRYDGALAVQVTRWSYEHGRPALGIKTYESLAHRSWGSAERGPYWKAQAYTLDYDADGRLATISWFHGQRELADGGDVDEAQAAARAGFPQDFEPTILYDARTHRRETELPELEHAFDGLAAPLCDELFAAIEQRRAALGPLEFVLVAAHGTRSRVVAADATFVERARRMTSNVRELVRAAYAAPRGTVRADVVDAASADVLRGLRAGEQALANHHGSDRHAEFQRELVVALNERAWADVAPTFVVLGLPGNEQGGRRLTLPELAELIGRHRVDAFLTRMAAPATSPRAKRVQRPRGREELVRLLVESGLTDDEARPVADDAQWGIALERGGTGVSRLGGAPVLAAGTPWPTAEDRALTHLATIALDELPAVEGREQLPDDGLLSFFADTSGEFVEPIEPDEESGRELVAVIHTPAGTPTHEPAPPGEALAERRVKPVGRLQLRYVGSGAGRQRYGIDALAETVLERLAFQINGDTPHQLLGHPPPVQEDPREPGQIVLFHITDDPGLRFSFLDAGDIHFLGAPDDIKRCRWERLTVIPNSC